MAIRISVLLVAVALICLFLRSSRPEIALMIALAAGAAAFVMSMDEIDRIVHAVKTALQRAEVESEDAETIIKAAGVSVAGEYAAQLCRDAGEGALAQRVDFAVKISLMALAVPLMLRVLDVILVLGI